MTGDAVGPDMINFWKNVSIAGAFLLLAITGPGRFLSIGVRKMPDRRKRLIRPTRSNTDCRPDKTQQASHQASCTECYKIEITPYLVIRHFIN